MRKIIMPTDTPNFTTRITVGDEVFNFGFRWNVTAERWAMSATNSNGDTLFQGMFVATGVKYCQLFTGFPENTELVFIGDESDDTFKNLYMVVSDDAESEFTN